MCEEGSASVQTSGVSDGGKVAVDESVASSRGKGGEQATCKDW